MATIILIISLTLIILLILAANINILFTLDKNFEVQFEYLFFVLILQKSKNKKIKKKHSIRQRVNVVRALYKPLVFLLSKSSVSASFSTKEQVGKDIKNTALYLGAISSLWYSVVNFILRNSKSVKVIQNASSDKPEAQKSDTLSFELRLYHLFYSVFIYLFELAKNKIRSI